MDGGLGAALSQATIASTRRTSVPTVHDTPLPLPADPADPLAGPTGATAQTGGFINAGTSPKSTGYGGFGSAVGFGGGLASSPNVPKPGSSINPATGLPHTAGLTRAELEAKKAQASSSSSAVAIDGSKLSDLSGREQAARQLTATAEEGITPGLEVPGGWGHVKQVPIPGSGPNAPTSVYEDIAEGLEKVGNAAFNLIPQGLKNALNPEAPVDKGKQPMGSPPKGRRSSVNVFLENAKAGLESAKTGTANLLHDVQDTFQSDRRLSLGGNKTAGTTGSGGVFTSVTNFFAESVNTVENQTNAKIAGPAAPRTSLPSNEVAGALPGERSTGVGALPGKSTEAGVAVLPEEKKLDPELPLGADPALKQQAPLGSNQSLLPGETAAVVPAASTSNETAHRDDSGGVGDLPGKPSETGVAILPEEKKLNHDLPADSSKDEHSGLSTLKTDVPAPNDHKDSSTGLAPPLPATVLGAGAAKGATDVEEAGLPVASATEPPSSVASEITNSTLDTATGPTESRHAADRATSTASITAIRHGHEGHKPSPLAESTVKEDLHSEEKEATGSTHDDKAVAPSTVDETKPDLTHSEAATSRDSSNPVTPRSPTSKLHNDSAVSTSTPTTATKTTPAAVSPTTHADHDSNVGHNRSGSTASTGSNGKKKVGFMNKLKGEMKVIGGKISHDEKKIQEGERLKHGA